MGGVTENPALAAMEAYRRTHLHRSDELDAAIAKYSETAEITEPDNLEQAVSEQLTMDERDDLTAQHGE